MEFPKELMNQIEAGDSVLSFANAEGGWVALTEKRLIYQSYIVRGDFFGNDLSDEVESVNLLLSKIDNIAVHDIKVKACPLKKKMKVCLIRKNVGVLSIDVEGTVYNVCLEKDTLDVESLVEKFVEIIQKDVV